jgi:phage terminase small subunit
MTLTSKQQRFVDEYLLDLNATQAAIKAGYSKKTARSVGSENLAKPDIAAAIQEAMKNRQARTFITQDRVLQELARIAFFDPRKLLDDDGNPIPLSNLDDDTAAAVAGVELMEEYEGSGKDRVFIGYTKKFKLADKNTAISNAMRHLGMFVDKSEITGKGGQPLGASVAGVLVVPAQITDMGAWEKLAASFVPPTMDSDDK